MSLEIKCCAIIAAAGQSARMGSSLSKQFLPLFHMPVIARTLTAFERADAIDRLFIVCRSEDRERMKRIADQYGIRKTAGILTGGKTRQESVFLGMQALPEHTEYVAIHDGARPLVTPEEIDSCVKDAQLTGASALGTPLKDTVKQINSDQNVLRTPSRADLWAVQTPQVFRTDLYRKALLKAQTDGKDYTDDCQLMEQMGITVHLCRGSYQNIKITTADDILFAEAILGKRGNTE